VVKDSFTPSAIEGHPVRHRDREDGEITSASEDDSRSLGLARLGLWKRKLESRLLSLQSNPYIFQVSEFGSEGGAAARAQGGIEWKAIQQLAILQIIVLAVRALIWRVSEAFRTSPAVVPAILTAALSGAAIAVFDSARDSLQNCRAISFNIGVARWILFECKLTGNEALGLWCMLVEFALQSMFENWGLHGPCWCRTLAVAGHALLEAGFVLGVSSWFCEDLNVKRKSHFSDVAWFCLIVGGWAATTWAAATWWQQATDATHPGEDTDDSLSACPASFGTAVPLPVAASIFVHAAHIWASRRAGSPVLLSISAILAAISTAGSCILNCGFDLVVTTGFAWLPILYASFCIVIGWVLWHELIEPL